MSEEGVPDETQRLGVYARKLRHMLGAEEGWHPKRHWGYRNFWCASIGGKDYADLMEMAGKGLVIKGHSGEKTVYFHATEAGCKLIGLTQAQIARAMD